MPDDKQTVIEVLFNGLMAFHRPARGGIGAGIHQTTPHHFLMITLRETGGPPTRPDFPLEVARGPLTDHLYITIDGKGPSSAPAFDPRRLKLAVLDGEGFHNRKLNVRQGVLAPCVYIDDAEFESETRPLYVIRRQSRETRELAMAVSAKITVKGEEKATLIYGQRFSYSFGNDGHSYRIYVANAEDMEHILASNSAPSGESDFQEYYSAFPEVEPDDKFDISTQEKPPSTKEVNYQRPCIPIFLETGMP